MTDPTPRTTPAPAVPRHRLPTAARQREIVTAVLALARERGPDAITTQAIAGLVGVTQGADLPALPRQGGDLARRLRLGTRSARRCAHWSGAEEPDTPLAQRSRQAFLAHVAFIAANPGVPARHVPRAAVSRATRRAQRTSAR
jgi:hypothetical protein